MVRIRVICDVATFVHTASYSTKVRCFSRHFDVHPHAPATKQINKGLNGHESLELSHSHSALLVHVELRYDFRLK